MEKSTKTDRRLALLAALALLLGSCAHERPARGPLPYGALDAPHTNDIVHDRTLIRGWALAESGIQSVAIYLDRSFAAFASLGFDRPDVGSVFPNVAGAATSGWQFNFVATGIRPGPHEILVQARSKDGATRDLGTATITVASP